MGTKIKTASNAEQMLSQCSECNSVKVLFKGDNRQHWQGCVAVFSHLEKEVCPACKGTVEKSVDMGITNN